MKILPFSLKNMVFDKAKSLQKDGGELIFLEQFKALRAKFEYQVDTYKYKVVAVTSAIAEEGKTLTCVNLAANLASTGRKKVLLIDTDLRKSDLSRCLNIPAKPGLSDFLNGAVSLDNVIYTYNSVKGLHVIPGGERNNTPSDLLAGETFRVFLQKMRDRFDLVLLDTPPLIPVADTMSLRDQIDSYILIFRIGFTPHVMLRQILEDIEKSKIMGVVLNGVELQKSKYYQKYYGKYYHKNTE